MKSGKKWIIKHLFCLINLPKKKNSFSLIFFFLPTKGYLNHQGKKQMDGSK